MALLSRGQILAAEDMPTEIVDVPEWGGSVKVKTLTGAERDAFEARGIIGRGRNREVNIQNIRARLVVETVVDDDCQPLFSRADINALGRKSSKALDRVFNAAMRLSGISEEDIEELGKASEDGQNGDSTSS